MYLKQVMIEPVDVGYRPDYIDDITVWMLWGWKVRLVLADVTEADFTNLKTLTSRKPDVVQFFSESNPANYPENTVILRFINTELVREFVKKGALIEPQVTLQLGKHVFALIEADLRNLSTDHAAH